MKIKIIIFTLLLSVQGNPFDAECADSIIAPGAKIEKLSGGFDFTEGPAVDKVGNIFFTDQPNNRIMKWSVDGKLSTFLKPSGRSNGLYFDDDGYLLSCADEKK